MPSPNETAAAAGHALTVGASFYQVLEPSKVLGPGGVQQYAMYGPFADLMGASSYANSRPGSFVTVTLMLHQVPAVAAAAAPSLVKR